jgi:hypothetical protein
MANATEQDLMNQAVLNAGLLDPWLDLAVLALGGALFLALSVLMHHPGRRLEY